jgi:hypothetical protein
MTVELNSMPDNEMKLMNFIKARPTNSRTFGTLCEKIGSIHNCLLTHNKVRWPLCGKIIVRLFKIKDEIGVLLTTHPFHKTRRMQGSA